MKMTIFVRNLRIVDELLNVINADVTEDEKVKPGQIRRKGKWYIYTFLRVVKVKNYDAVLDDTTDTDVNSIRSVSFIIDGGRLYVKGGKSDIKEVGTLFESYTLRVAADDKDNDNIVEPDKYYKIESPEVDLFNLLKIYEEKETISGISKIRVKPMEISVGKIQNCIVNTEDYGRVRAMLSESDNNVFGMELKVSEPDKTLLYYDLDGQVRVQAKELEDLEQYVLDCAVLV